jgi:predicted ArsR family transcriptional regulator
VPTRSREAKPALVADDRVGSKQAVDDLCRRVVGVRIGEIAEWLQLTPGAVTQLVDYLEGLGLVERLRAPSLGGGSS